jgi:uncharacterized protein YdaU (DUF1376 family)
MGSADLPPMPWHPQEFLVLTAHWAYAERSALRALADYQWIQGVLPKEHDRLARLIGISQDELEKLWPFLSTQFVEVDGGLQNPQLEARRIKALRLQKSHARGARTAHANRRAQKGAQLSTKQEQSIKLANGGNASEKAVPISAPSSLSLRDLSSLPSEEVSRETKASPSAQVWRDTPGLSIDAFEAYLEHLEVLRSRGTIRAVLAPHSQLEAARWLSMQGSHSNQLEIVGRAIRHGWKTLEKQERALGAHRKTFDEMHAEKP